MRMNKPLSIAALLLASFNARAGTTGFSVVNGINDPGLDVLLTLRASDTPGYAYDFIVTNLSKSGSITGVYFERDWTRKLKGVGTSAGPATYRPASLSPDVAGWLGPMGSHTVAQTATWVGQEHGHDLFRFENITDDGLKPGQSQVFSFVTDTTIISLQDLEDTLATKGFNVAVQAQGLTDHDPLAPAWLLANDTLSDGILLESLSESSNAVTATVAPTPTAAAGIALFGLARLARRRRA